MKINTVTPLDLAKKDLLATRQPLLGLHGRVRGAELWKEAASQSEKFRYDPDEHIRAVAFAAQRLRRLRTAGVRARGVEGRRRTAYADAHGGRGAAAGGGAASGSSDRVLSFKEIQVREKCTPRCIVCLLQSRSPQCATLRRG